MRRGPGIVERGPVFGRQVVAGGGKQRQQHNGQGLTKAHQGSFTAGGMATMTAVGAATLIEIKAL
jgi:hypothetical protein